MGSESQFKVDKGFEDHLIIHQKPQEIWYNNISFFGDNPEVKLYFFFFNMTILRFIPCAYYSFPHTILVRLIYVRVSVSGSLLRHGWPSRRQSQHVELKLASMVSAVNQPV